MRAHKFGFSYVSAFHQAKIQYRKLISDKGFPIRIRYCWGVAVQKDLSFGGVKKHISEIMESIKTYHPHENPLFIMAYGNELLPKLEETFPQAQFIFNPVLADEIAMPEAKELMEQLFKKR